jgi:hypothetical protein
MKTPHNIVVLPAAVNATSACGLLHRAILVAEFNRAGCDAHWRCHVTRIIGIGGVSVSGEDSIVMV